MTFEDQLRETVRQAVASAVGDLMAPREWLTPEQVGELLGYERSTVYQKIKRGVIPSRLFDGRILVSRTELYAAISESPSAAPLQATA